MAEAPPSLPPCFTFFLPLHRPLSEGLGHSEASPATYTKTCPAYAYATPFVPTLPKTASPERLLRPPLASSPASNFFYLYNAPSQEASGNSLYMWPRPSLASPLLQILSPFTAPSPEASGKSLYMWPGLASLAPTTYTKTYPACITSFLPTHGRRTFLPP